ncbi:MAG TPA: adenylate/guanylate cyclase domain-containing protein [Dongiaceae bacterium]|nr:adenylate/guanylate cyclase domain-containing protein [Dongiaceae bacterium]
MAILFADLSGFTALSSKLDAEDLRQLVEAFYAKVEGVIAHYGGTVDKHIGDAVMALFGAPVAHGDDALRAVRSALDIQLAVPELKGPSGEPLAAHVGIANGEVVAGGIGRGYTVLGDAVNLAARLVELAKSGETVISDALHRQLQGQVRASALMPANLKGIAGPVTGWRVEGLASERGPATPFVGRDADLSMLGGLLQACRGSRRGRIVVLRGEAGIGKSRLTDEIARLARTRDFVTHRTLILDFGTGKGQDAMRLLTRSLLMIAPGSDKQQRKAAADQALAIGWIAPGERPSLDDLLDIPSESEERTLYQAMDESTRQVRRRGLLTGLVQRLAADRPLFVTVEDAHWADAVLLDDLAALGAITTEAALVLAITTRPEGDPLDRSWRAKIGAAAVSTIDLSPLSSVESATLAADLLGSGDERIAACVERAGGNPFFLEQLLRHTGEVATAAVPASVQSLVLGRADRLPAMEKRALQAASILGQRVSLSALRHLLGEPAYEAKNLIDQQFLRQDGGELAFVHALMREGVYGSLLKTRRRELHRAAAGWFGERDLPLRAQHLEMAEDGDAPRAYLAAAESTAAAYRIDQALSLAQRGLSLPADDVVRSALANLSGELLQGMARTKEAIEAFRLASEGAAGGQPRLRALLGLAQGLSVLDKFDEATAVLDRAQAEAESMQLLAEQSRIHTLRGNAYFPRGNIARCLAEHSEALRLAEASGAMEEQARALGGLGDGYYVKGHFHTSGKLFERCVNISASQGFRRIEAANLPMLGMMMMMDMNFENALELAQRAVALSEQIGHRRAAMIAYHGIGFLGFDIGDMSVARQGVEAGLAIAEALGARRFIAEGLIIRAQYEFLTGDARAGTTLAEANEIARETPSYILPYGLAVAALIAPNEPARRAALNEGEAVLAAGAISHNYLFFNRNAMEACIMARDWPGARHYASALERRMADEPFAMSDFLVARARVLAAAGEGRKDEAKIRLLLDQAGAVKWRAVIPALEAALAA